MTRAIGGYVRRSERRHVPPVPDDGTPRCSHCRARLGTGMWPHLCKEVTYGTAITAPQPIPLIPADRTS